MASGPEKGRRFHKEPHCKVQRNTCPRERQKQRSVFRGLSHGTWLWDTRKVPEMRWHWSWTWRMRTFNGKTQGVLKTCPAGNTSMWAETAKPLVWADESCIGTSKKDKSQAKPTHQTRNEYFYFIEEGRRYRCMFDSAAPKTILSTSSQKVTARQVASHTQEAFRVTGTGNRAGRAPLSHPGHLPHTATTWATSEKPQQIPQNDFSLPVDCRSQSQPPPEAFIMHAPSRGPPTRQWDFPSTGALHTFLSPNSKPGRLAPWGRLPMSFSVMRASELAQITGGRGQKKNE